MSFITFATKEINCKIAYCGPALAGKTTNLQFIYANAPPETKGKMTSLASETERTMFFDFALPDPGTIQGFTIRLHLYTIPGRVYYEASHKLILKGADGVVFVADSQRERLEENAESIRRLESNLKECGLDLATLPYALQLNKRDLPNAMAVEELRRVLDYKSEPTIEAVATSGQGVLETLRAVSEQIIAELRKK